MVNVLLWVLLAVMVAFLVFLFIVGMLNISMLKRPYAFYINGNKFTFEASVMSSSRLFVNDHLVDEQPYQYGTTPRTLHYEAEGLNIRVNVGTMFWWPKFVFSVFVNNVKLPTIYGNGENIVMDGIVFPENIAPTVTVNSTTPPQN